MAGVYPNIFFGGGRGTCNSGKDQGGWKRYMYLKIVDKRGAQALSAPFLSVPLHDFFFGQILTREFKPTKPDPDPILHICKQWGVKPYNTVMVGDHFHDIQCGTSAGAGKHARQNLDGLSIVTFSAPNTPYDVLLNSPLLPL